MTDPNLFRMRVTYAKQGRLALLSHLEIARALERAVRRSGLPFAVSKGFSPHMKIAFGAALPVEVGGTEEIFDLQTTSYVAPDKALAALQAASVPDLMPSACKPISPREPAASVAYPFGTYEAVLSEAPATLIVPETVQIIRKRKERTLAVADFLCGDMEVSGNTVRFTLEAKPTGSLRPDLFMKSVCEASLSESGAPLEVISLMRVRQER